MTNFWRLDTMSIHKMQYFPWFLANFKSLNTLDTWQPILPYDVQSFIIPCDLTKYLKRTKRPRYAVSWFFSSNRPVTKNLTKHQMSANFFFVVSIQKAKRLTCFFSFWNQTTTKTFAVIWFLVTSRSNEKNVMLGRGWVKSFVRNSSWSAKNTRSKYIAVIVCMHFGSEKWWFCEWSGQAIQFDFFILCIIRSKRWQSDSS